MRVPVHILSGFLGTGKTTALLDQLRRRRDERVAVLVNDFGEASIDPALVAEAGPSGLSEIDGACVCCTAPEGFTDAIRALLDDAHAARIFIEPTGLARPADLIDTLLRGPHRDRIALQPVVVLVDPHTFDPDDDLVRDQAEVADVLVANRTDLATEAEIARFDAWASTRWPAPLAVYRTTHGRLPDGALGWPQGEGLRAPRHHHHHHPAEKGASARTLTWSSEVTFDRDRVEDALRRMATDASRGTFLRVKGMFRTAEGVWLLEVAGGRVHARPTSYRRDSRVDLFVAGADPSPLDAAAAWLDDAMTTEAERALDRDRVEIVLPDGTRRRFDRAHLAALPDGVPDITRLLPKRRGAAARVRSLLASIDAPANTEVVVIAADGFATAPVPSSALDQALLVHSVDGAPLASTEGGPYRLLIPGDAGPGGPCANVKGVVRIVLRAAVPAGPGPESA